MRTRCFPTRFDIQSPAKVNLFLELPKKRDDGFHEINTVMSAVSLYDQLSFVSVKESDSCTLKIQYASPGNTTRETDLIPADDSNLILRAVQLVRDVARSEIGSQVCSEGLRISLLKRIPSAAGLGGASGNAAAALIAANYLWRLDWPREKLSDLGARLGSDIPFFLFGGTSLCTGRGERVRPLELPAGHPVLIVKPENALSTADVFSKVSIAKMLESPANLIEQLNRANLVGIGRCLFNRLQRFAEPMSLQIAKLCDYLRQLESCLGSQMTGSGSSCFGVFPTFWSARRAANTLSARHPNLRIFCTTTLGPFSFPTQV